MPKEMIEFLSFSEILQLYFRVLAYPSFQDYWKHLVEKQGFTNNPETEFIERRYYNLIKLDVKLQQPPDENGIMNFSLEEAETLLYDYALLSHDYYKNLPKNSTYNIRSRMKINRYQNVVNVLRRNGKLTEHDFIEINQNLL